MDDQEILRLEGVDFVRESRQILTGINLTVRAGERWALIGPNGAGKSTILSMCGAVKHPTRGSVRVLGRKLGRVDIRELRESIGHVNPRHSLSSPLTAHRSAGHTHRRNWHERAHAALDSRPRHPSPC